MTQAFVIPAVLALGLAGCASATRDLSYALPQGDANYDALRKATEACQVKGGSVTLRKGYDERQLSSYLCVIGKAR